MIARAAGLRGREGRFADAKGELRVWFPSARVIASEFMGVLSVELAQHLALFSDEWLARERGKLTGFHDWECMLGYEAAARMSLTRWAVSIAPRIEELHFLSSSTMVRMGLQVGNLTLKVRMHSYTARVAFDTAFEALTGTQPSRLFQAPTVASRP